MRVQTRECKRSTRTLTSDEPGPSMRTRDLKSLSKVSLLRLESRSSSGQRSVSSGMKRRRRRESDRASKENTRVATASSTEREDGDGTVLHLRRWRIAEERENDTVGSSDGDELFVCKDKPRAQGRSAAIRRGEVKIERRASSQNLPSSFATATACSDFPTGASKVDSAMRAAVAGSGLT